jgi:hypothetical protein
MILTQMSAREIIKSQDFPSYESIHHSPIMTTHMVHDSHLVQTHIGLLASILIQGNELVLVDQLLLGMQLLHILHAINIKVKMATRLLLKW